GPRDSFVDRLRRREPRQSPLLPFDLLQFHPTSQDAAGHFRNHPLSSADDPRKLTAVAPAHSATPAADRSLVVEVDEAGVEGARGAKRPARWGKSVEPRGEQDAARLEQQVQMRRGTVVFEQREAWHEPIQPVEPSQLLLIRETPPLCQIA